MPVLPANAARNARILGLARKGMTCAAIAERLGLTKRTVNGVVDRGLGERPRQRHAKQAKPLPAARGHVPMPEPAEGTCRFIHGEPGTRTAKWCGWPAAAGSQYCAAHLKRVYQPARVAP